MFCKHFFNTLFVPLFVLYCLIISAEDQTIQKKPTKIELIDIKDAKKVDNKDYNKTFQEGEHQFIYKCKHKSLRAKYNL